jgi:superfamily II DNA/RNA helicase
LSFNSAEAKECVDFLVEYLARKELAPHPHIRLIGPKSTWGTEPTSIWTVADKVKTNYIGFEFTCRPHGQNPTATTLFDFFIRIGSGSSANDFQKFSIRIQMGIESDICELEITSNSNRIQETLHPASIYGKDQFRKKLELGSFPITSSEGKQENQDIELIFEKSRETLSDGCIRIQVKLINDSEQEIIYEPNYDPLTVIDALSIDEQTENDLEPDTHTPTSVSTFTRLTLGALMEFKLSENLSNAEFEASVQSLKKKSPVTRVFNVVSQSETSNTIEFADYLSVEEFIPTLIKGKGLKKFQQELSSVGLHLEDEVIAAFDAIFSKFDPNPSFYAYQEGGIKSILQEMRDRKNKPQLISIRTAGGKTELFLAPILDFCIKNIDKLSTKSLIFYPTKALANDQSRRLFDLLLELNTKLVSSGKRAITMGIYHGGIESNNISWVPFKCKHCGAYLEARDPTKSVLSCTSSECQSSEVYEHALLTRNEIHRNPPDILITNPDVINYVLAIGGGRQSFLGRKIVCCDTCGLSIPNITKRKCPRASCNGKMIKVTPDGAPEILVYDEVHLVYGAFGSNVINLNHRLTKIIRKNLESDAPFIRIALSATIRSPEKFGSKFFCCDSDDIEVIPTDIKTAYASNSISSRRHALFLMPRNWSGHDTVGYSLAKMMEWVGAKSLDVPRILSFTNSIRDCNHLIGNVQNRIPNMSDKVDGHNTQFSKTDRANVEMRFNKGDLCVLFATSTLEVGVDFSDIDVLYIYHAPPNFNAYLQRVGRAGRRGDAIVISVLNSKSANDYYYFENSRDLLENKERYMSRIPITATNPRVLEKHLIAAFFDWLEQNESIIDKYLTQDYLDYLLQNDPLGWKPNIRDELQQYLVDVFGVAHTLIIDKMLVDLENELLSPDVASLNRFGDTFDYLNKKLFFMNMRQSDPTIEIKIEEVD